jgi:hypothetical protein
MEKKTSIVLLLMVLMPLLLYTQTPECSTSGTSSYLHLLENVRIADNSNDSFYVKVYVHVLQHSLTGPGQTILGINEAMKRLYNDFDPLKIHFIWDGQVDYIENDDWHETPGNHFSEIVNHNYHTDGIDIYLGPSINPNAFAESSGVGENTAFLVSGYSNVVLDEVVFWPQSPVISHEMGHVLFLFHTFHGSPAEPGPPSCAECLNDIDKQLYCGDYIFDTPPDYVIDVDNNCNYTGGGVDICGNDLNPLTNNYMSYVRFDCRNSFTQGQKARMKNAITVLPPLQPTQLVDYAYIRGKSIICFSDVYKILSNDANSLTIENSINIGVSINSVSSTEINFVVFNLDPTNSVGEPAWIIITRNGVELTRKDFWIGKPPFVNSVQIQGDIYVDPGEIQTYCFAGPLEGTRLYQWIFPGYTPEEIFPFHPPYDQWQYDYLTKYSFKARTQVGGCPGEIFLYGINECGDALISDDGLTIHVNNPIPPCPPIPEPVQIIYYPNPADAWLEIDLSLEAYKIFDIVVYNDSQVAVYTEQSTNVIATIDTFNLIDGTYYLHIYDETDLILNKILIVSH